MESPQTYDVRDLDEIFKKTILAVENGREDIYAISEAARQEFKRIQLLLEDIRHELNLTINEVDEVEHLFQRARIRLMQVSKSFSQYSEDEIRDASEKAHDLQLKLSTAREREKELKRNRDDLERTLKKLKEMVERSEKMVAQVSIAVEILRGNLEVAIKAFADMQQKYQYGVRVVLAQEEERKRVAREIHDGPVQSLANVVLRADYCQRLYEVAKDPLEITSELSYIKKLVQDILVEMRQIIFNLRPMSLDDLGLVPALARFIATLQKNTSVFIEIVKIGQEVRLPAAMEIALFRMAQESINNAIKHSDCTHIVVKLEFVANEVILVIIDDGNGFNLEQTKAVASERQNFGLLGMEERIKLLGGKFGIETELGSGTKVWARLTYDLLGGETNNE